MSLINNKMEYSYFSLMFVVVHSVNMNFPKKFCDIESDSALKQCFLKEVLVSMAHSPNQLAVDRAANTLYLSFDSGQGEYIPAALKIETKKLTVLKGVQDAFAIAHDAVENEMYFGGSHGIYKYNPVKKNLKRLAVGNLDVWWLFVKKNMYFIKFPSLNAYSYQNRTMRNVPQLRSKTIHQFVFDNEDNIFFINTTGLYGVKNDSDDAILLRDYPRFLGMALDNKGQIYVCSDDAIFVVSKLVQKVVRLLAVSNENYYDTLNSISF
jgi:hypothetical protein